MVRYVCLDFETNGFAHEGGEPMPWASFPIQVSLTAVEDGEVIHLYDSYIQGAESLSPWVFKNMPISLTNLENAPRLPEVIKTIAGLLRRTDWIVAHNCAFDLETCLARTSKRLNLYSKELHFIFGLPRFCTMDCSYMRSVCCKRGKLPALCAHFGVAFDEKAAHDATYDSLQLARCVAEAGRRGVMVDSPYTVPPDFSPQIPGPDHPDFAIYYADLVAKVLATPLTNKSEVETFSTTRGPPPQWE